MIKYFIWVLVFLAIAIGNSEPVQAHYVDSNAGISGRMHIAPNDQPHAGVPSTFAFIINDVSRKFRPEDCNCQLSVSLAGRQLSQQALFEGNFIADFQHPQAEFTFPEVGVYEIKVQGEPLTAGVFSSFSLVYNVRVESVAVNESTLIGRETILGFSGISVIGTTGYFLRRRLRSSGRTLS